MAREGQMKWNKNGISDRESRKCKRKEKERERGRKERRQLALKSELCVHISFKKHERIIFKNRGKKFTERNN